MASSPRGFNGLFNSNHRTESQDGRTGRGVGRGEDEEKGVKMKRSRREGGRKEKRARIREDKDEGGKQAKEQVGGSEGSKRTRRREPTG